MNLNKVMIAGNLTRDPEVKYTPKGTAICDIGLAISRQWKTDAGEKREETTFIDVTCFGRTAEIVGEYLKKGRPAFIEGRLQLDSWDDKQSGQKRTKLKVVCDNLQLIGGREQQGGQQQAATKPHAAPVPAPSKPAAPPAEDEDEDSLPF